MAELKLTGMAAEFAPPPKPRAAFKPRGLANRKRTQVRARPVFHAGAELYAQSLLTSD